MYKIAIVEDDEREVKVLTDFLEQFGTQNGEEFSISRYPDGLTFLDQYRGDLDIVFVDINMPLLNGFETSKRLRERDPHICIVFITNMAQYAIKGYEVAARDFILKPLQYVDFSFRMKKLIAYCRATEQKEILLRDKAGFQRVALRDIYYVEVNGHTVIYHTVNGDYDYRGSMKLVMEQLGGHLMFASCNQSYLVNLRYVESFRNNVIRVRGVNIPIGRTKRESFVQRLTAYLKEV